jgi:AbrB family transcriptional regulator, transcriptional pleiotropic regulator of transition state genes
MATTGIRRKVDELGRVVIPATLRKTLGIVEGDELEFALDGDRLLLSRATDRCVFCDGEEGLETYLGRPVCWSCMAAVRALERDRPRSPFS